MSIYTGRRFHTLAPLVLVAATFAMLDGCSKAGDDNAASAPNPTSQAQAVQSSIVSAQAAHDHLALGMTQDDSAAAAPTAPMAIAPAGGDIPSMSAGAPTPTGMARMLGQPPMTGGSSAAGGLPAAIGAPHIYHLGADTFFLDQTSAISLTGKQQKALTALKENAITSMRRPRAKLSTAQDATIVGTRISSGSVATAPSATG